MRYSTWKKLSWLFLAAILAESIYSGVRFNCWAGTAACVLGFGAGFLSTKIKNLVAK